MVFLKVAPWKRVIRFQKRGKLNPRYIGPFRILGRIRLVAYRLKLPPDLEWIHNVFHVSRLRKYILDPSHVLEAPLAGLNENLIVDVQLVGIIDRRTKELRDENIPMLKVLWQSDTIKEMTWKTKASIRKKYPYLFPE